MKLCLFIGHHKVGSTALQDFLWRNAAALLRAGILYPPVESEGHALLLARMRGDAWPERELAPFNAREAHNALAFRLQHETLGMPLPPWHPNLPSAHQMGVTLRNLVRFLEPSAVILCSEVFANFGALAPHLVGQVVGLFPAAEGQVHCTLRRPDQYVASWQGQRLRFGHQLRPLRAGGLAAHVGTVHLDYELMLRPWLTAFPKGASIRNYADVLAAGGSVPDFVARSGLAFPAGLEPEQRVNGSIHPALMDYARQANHLFPARLAIRFCELLIEVSDRLPLPPRNEVELFGPAVRAELLQHFAPSAAFLDARLGRPFFPDLAQAADPAPIPELEAARAARAPLLALLRETDLPAEISDFVRTAELE